MFIDLGSGFSTFVIYKFMCENKETIQLTWEKRANPPMHVLKLVIDYL